VKPNRVVAVDWSGARTGEHRKIWLAEIGHGRVQRLENGRSREAVTHELVRIARAAVDAGERVVIGLDFSFGFPAWYAGRHGWQSGPDVWRAWTADRAERTLVAPEFPFWGRGAHPQKPAALHDDSETPPLRRTELAQARRPFSVFQLVGAGAVGPGSLRGMATLRALAEAGARVWPFDDIDDGAGALVLEIWPRLYAPNVNKSNAEERVAFVRGLSSWRSLHACDASCHVRAADVNADAASVHALDQTRCPLEQSVRKSDDAFDALVSAIALWDARSQLGVLRTAQNPTLRIEGCVWNAGI
jgi:hypothetical protein